MPVTSSLGEQPQQGRRGRNSFLLPGVLFRPGGLRFRRCLCESSASGVGLPRRSLCTASCRWEGLKHIGVGAVPMTSRLADISQVAIHNQAGIFQRPMQFGVQIGRARCAACSAGSSLVVTNNSSLAARAQFKFHSV